MAVTKVFVSWLLWCAYIYSEILSMRYAYAQYNCVLFTRKALCSLQTWNSSAHTARSVTLHDLSVREKTDKARPQWERQTLTGREREGVAISQGHSICIKWRTCVNQAFKKERFSVTNLTLKKNGLLVTKKMEFSVKVGVFWWHVYENLGYFIT